MPGLSVSILEALNRQYAHEVHNAHRYTIRASLADYCGLTGIRDFFTKQASDEMGHAKKVFDYIIDRGDKLAFALPGLDEPAPENVLGMFDTALAVEIDTTAKLKSIYALALAEGDYLTLSWLTTGLLAEQIEEEDTFMTILDRLRSRLGMTPSSAVGVDGDDPELGAAIHDFDVWIKENYAA